MLPQNKRPGASILILAAAAFAAAELLAVLLPGRFFGWGRAEALLFFAVRPWLLVALALFAARCDLKARAALYAGALGLAALGESLFLLGLGAANPWPEAGRGLLAGVLLVALFDLVIQLGGRWLNGKGMILAAVAIAALLLVPGGLRPYEAIVLGAPATAPASPKPRLMLMSALPLTWGETGPLDPQSRPAAAYQALAERFEITPLDVLTDGDLAKGTLLLLAQPRVLDPRELVALDSWVRGGGRVLILTDPLLTWPSALPLGDIRRAPSVGLLGPLLDHWGLELGPAGVKGIVTDDDPAAATGRLTMVSPGRFLVTGADCRRTKLYFASCRLGQGRAMLVADADLLHDSAWAGPGGGVERHRRVADNPLIVAGWLDGLAGISRPPADGVEWLAPYTPRGKPILLGLLPLGLALIAAATLMRIRGR